MAKVSIVIPFYNKPELLKEMVNSVLKQSFKDWELLLIDDGSDEITLECANSYKDADSRIKLLKRNRLPKGAQACRNIGLENAKGEYICFFDSDDIVLPFCLQNRVSYMDKNPNLDFGVFRAKTYDSLKNSKPQYLGVRRTSDDVKFFINGFLPFAVWTNIYRTKSLRRTKTSWDENILSLQDSDFNIQNIVVHKLKYDYSEGDFDYLWRVNNNKNSITKKIYSNIHFKSHLYFFNKLAITMNNYFRDNYDEDLSLRLFNFCLIFAEQNDTNGIKRLIQIGKSNGLEVGNIKIFQLYASCIKNINSNLLKKLIQISVFPKLSNKRHHIIKQFLTQTSLCGK